MFRTKVAVALVLVFAVMTGFLWYRLDDHVETMARRRVDGELRLALGALEVMRRLQDYSNVDKAAEIAGWPQLAEILARPKDAFADPSGNPPTDEAYRSALHDLAQKEVLAWASRFDNLADGRIKPEGTLADSRRERPDLFMVVDADGIAVANGLERDWYGARAADLRKEFPAVTRVLEEGRILQDIWIVKNAPISVAMAPVRRDGRVVGAVAIGYRMEAEEARRDQRLVASGVAYFVGDRIQQSSTLNGSLERELAEQFKAGKIHEGVGSAPRGIEVTLGGRKYLGYVGTLESKASAKHAGFFVFANLEGALAAAKAPLMAIPIAGALCLMLALGLVLLFWRREMEPFMEIDHGVLETINGNLDYWFDIPGKSLAGTMSQNLNIMVCQLSGRPMPEDDDAPEGEHWAEDRMFIDEIDPSEFHARPIDSALAEQNAFVPADAHSGMGFPPDILRLVRETDEVYRRRLFKEYTEALRAQGEPVAGISFEKFTAKLDANAQALKTKYKAQRVRFLVVVAEGKVALKPVPIN